MVWIMMASLSDHDGLIVHRNQTGSQAQPRTCEGWDRSTPGADKLVNKAAPLKVAQHVLSHGDYLWSHSSLYITECDQS